MEAGGVETEAARAAEAMGVVEMAAEAMEVVEMAAAVRAAAVRVVVAMEGVMEGVRVEGVRAAAAVAGESEGRRRPWHGS